MLNHFHETDTALTAAERYSNAAPVPNFNIVRRPLPPEFARERLLSIAAALCAAEEAGKPWDVELYAQRLTEDVQAMLERSAQRVAA